MPSRKTPSQLQQLIEARKTIRKLEAKLRRLQKTSPEISSAKLEFPPRTPTRKAIPSDAYVVGMDQPSNPINTRLTMFPNPAVYIHPAPARAYAIAKSRERGKPFHVFKKIFTVIPEQRTVITEGKIQEFD